MTPWWQRRMCVFDLETTAPEPVDARIVTACVAFVGGGEETESLTWLADPGVDIPEGATAIHGITTEKAREDGIPPKRVVEYVMDELCRATTAGMAVVIFNARYDLTVLLHEAARHRVPWTLDAIRVFDPLVVDKWLERYRPGSRKLTAICEHYGAKLDAAHDAAEDAIAAGRLAYAMGKRGRVVRRVRDPREADELGILEDAWEAARDDLERLHNSQVWWARDQAKGLAEHFAKTGDSEGADRVRLEWPWVPADDAGTVTRS